MLNHIRIIDLTSYLSGPYCTWILGALGAEIIKIERPGLGDLARTTAPNIGGPDTPEESIYFASVNRHKKSLTLDLKTAAGRQILEQLIPTADALIENFRPGVMDRLGLDDETLHRLNPRLVRASISGFGQTGPLAERPAYDVVAQAMSGLMSITGPEGGEPTRAGVSIGDMAAGLFAAIGILARIIERDQQAGAEAGPRLDLSMVECQMALMENAIARYLNAGEVPQRLGTRHQSVSPFQAFPTADGMIIIAASSDAEWERLCQAIGGEPLLADPRFAGKQARLENTVPLAAALTEILVTQPTQTWLDILIPAQVPCGPLHTVPEVLASEQIQARGLVEQVTTTAGNTFSLVKNPITREGLNAQAAPPAVGEHTAEILQNLGYEEGEIGRLREEGII